MNHPIKPPVQKSRTQIAKSPNHTIVNIAATAVGLVSWAVVVLWGVLLDDHFGRITLGYQWLTYGHIPFKDFFDPGLVGAAAWSAAALWLSGGTLAGEMLLDGAAIGVGLGLTCALASRASGSPAAGVFCAALSFLAGPRLYDYDKLLFYPLGLLACWRYADHPNAPRALIVGIVIAAGAILRYDTALYLGASWLVTLLGVHGASRAVVQRGGISVVPVCVVSIPVVLWIHSSVGLRDAVDQVTSYARIERERSVLFDWSSLIWSGSFPQAWNAVMSRGPAPGVLYLTVLSLPVLAVATAFSSLTPTRRSPPVGRTHLVTAATLCGLLTIFILRDPLPARFGGVLPIATVLAASIAGFWLREKPRQRLSWRTFAVAAAAAAAAMGVIEAGEIDRFERLWLGGPVQVAEVGRSQARMLTEVPPALGLMPGGVIMRTISWYLRQCTPPATPVLAIWFAPHVYYFAERPFAGGMWAYFGNHWSQPGRQAQVVQRLQLRPAAIVIRDRLRYGEFEDSHRLIAAYLDREYRRAGRTSFDRIAAPTYDVLVRRDSTWSGLDPVWGLPCDQQGPGARGQWPAISDRRPAIADR